MTLSGCWICGSFTVCCTEAFGTCSVRWSSVSCACQSNLVWAEDAADDINAFATYVGGTGQGGDTLQALRRNRKVDPLAEPGLAELTAHVDYQALADTARAAGAGAAGPVPQGAFLERLGISLRARALAQGLSGASLENHIAAHRRLTHPAEMGDLFKALAILPPGAAAPAGFAP